MLQQQEVLELYYGFAGDPRHNLQSYIHQSEQSHRIGTVISGCSLDLFQEADLSSKKCALFL
jgi:hypothetical protein